MYVWRLTALPALLSLGVSTTTSNDDDDDDNRTKGFYSLDILPEVFTLVTTETTASHNDDGSPWTISTITRCEDRFNGPTAISDTSLIKWTVKDLTLRGVSSQYVECSKPIPVTKVGTVTELTTPTVQPSQTSSEPDSSNFGSGNGPGSFQRAAGLFLVAFFSLFFW